MLSLEVFCVVLYLHAGVGMPNGNDRIYFHEENNDNNQFKRNYPIPLSTQNIPNGNPTNLGWQKSAPDIYRRTEEPYQKSEADIRPQGMSYDHTKSMPNIFPVSTLNEPNPIEYHTPQLSQRPGEIIYGSQPLSQNSYLPTHRRNRPINQEQDLRLEVQGVSLEHVKSLLDTTPMKTPLQRHDTKKDIDITYAGSNVNSEKISYQNPSAEIMYKTNQALPYEVNVKQLTGSSQDNNHLRNIINNNSKTVANLYSSHQPSKRYTIVHPDGRVEHVDHLEKATSKYSDYVLVKSTDIKKYIENNKFLNKTPNKPITTPNIPVIASTNVNKPAAADTKKNQWQETFPMIKNDQLPTISNQQVSLETATPSDVKPCSFDTSKAQPLGAANNVKENEHDSSFILNNPSSTVTTQTSSEINIPSKIDESSSTKISNDSINFKKLTVANLTIDSEIVEILPQDRLLNTTNVHSAENSRLALPLKSPESPDFEHIASQDELDTNKSNATSNSLNGTVPFDLQEENEELSYNATNSFTSDEDSLINELLAPQTANVKKDTEKFWFKTDENFWDKLIKNDTQNIVYFIFVPPKPKTEKETKTIYPNGTIVEEVMITVNDENGVPTSSKTTTVTHINST